jgi:hypothetical protein
VAFFISGLPWLCLPVPHQKSTQILAPPSDFSQIPVQPSHHIANVPGATCSCSISSFSQLPHSGKVLRIHDSRVMVFTLLIVLTPGFNQK